MQNYKLLESLRDFNNDCGKSLYFWINKTKPNSFWLTDEAEESWDPILINEGFLINSEALEIEKLDHIHLWPAATKRKAEQFIKNWMAESESGAMTGDNQLAVEFKNYYF